MGFSQGKRPGIPQIESIGLESNQIPIFDPLGVLDGHFLLQNPSYGPKKAIFLKLQIMRNRHYILLLIFWLALPLTSFTVSDSSKKSHKFYVSVTSVEYVQAEESLQIISRIFIDDLESALQARYTFKAAMGTADESELVTESIQRYFNAKFTVFVNGKPREYTFVGKKYDRDQVICYLEVSGVSEAGLESVGIQNEILMDVFEEQKNLVHLKILGIKKSYVLVRENNKGMLNL